MILDFPIQNEPLDFINNYDLFMMPNGVYRAKRIRADNYLYPMYYIKEGDECIVSTSVYALIHYKKRFVRNPKFQTVHFYQPTFMTVDKEIMRARTVHRRSTLELRDKKMIAGLGARLIQDYITEIETRYPGWVHILSMGGKDSQNIILARRKERWVVLTGEPSVSLNERFIRDNDINIERFIPVSNQADNIYLLQEIMASDCMFDVAHFRWVKIIYDLVKEFSGKAVFWMGTDGDGIFKRNNNHRDRDYYAVHELHVGTAMGVWHQMLKNFLNIPVVSPYQSPYFLDELFYRFDPYFVDKNEDLRPQIGEILFGKPVRYPVKNLTPAEWKRNRHRSMHRYIEQLKRENILCKTIPLRSWAINKRERVLEFLEQNSCKRRTPLSRILFPLRRNLAKVIPAFKINRHNIQATEIK